MISFLFDGKIRENEYSNFLCIWFDGKNRETEHKTWFPFDLTGKFVKLNASFNLIHIWTDGKICKRSWGHNYQVWKKEKFSLTEKIFREIKYLDCYIT